MRQPSKEIGQVVWEVGGCNEEDSFRNFLINSKILIYSDKSDIFLLNSNNRKYIYLYIQKCKNTI